MSYKNIGREAMRSRHSVFKVYDIPPAAYYGPGIPSGVIPEFKAGNVCSRGLWDEAVDQPVAYPFVADREGMCYIPNYNGPTVAQNKTTESPPLASHDPNKPKMQSNLPCNVGCKWTD